MNIAVEISLESKTFGSRSSSVRLLEGFRLTVCEGERIAIVGESGAGKSSLLNIIGLLDRRFDGVCKLFGTDVSSLSDREAARWRNNSIGFVLQESALIDSLSIEENIKLPMLYTSSLNLRNRISVSDIAESLGISGILHKKPLDCSGGEKARAVFARAIAMNPRLILADEPTASLDSGNRSKVASLLLDPYRNFDATIITVTHDLDLARQHDRIVSLQRNG